jgi:hypothetical protein
MTAWGVRTTIWISHGNVKEPVPGIRIAPSAGSGPPHESKSDRSTHFARRTDAGDCSRISVDSPRIAFVDMPRMTLDILTNALSAAGIPITGTFSSSVSLEETADRSGADVIVTSPDYEPLASVDRFLHSHPSARVLVLEKGGSDGVLYELRPNRVALGELSPSAFVRVVCALGQAAPLP